MQVCNILATDELTITEYSLTTSAQLDYRIQEERTLYLVLRLRGKTEHDTNVNVTNKMQTDFHAEHMKLYTWHEHVLSPFVCLVSFCLRQYIHELHTTSCGSRVLRMSSHPCMKCSVVPRLWSPFSFTSSSSNSSLISCTSSCTSSTTLRAVATLRTPPKRVWTLLTTPTSSQWHDVHQRSRPQFLQLLEKQKQFGVPTVFESFVSQRSHGDFALQVRSKESTQSGSRC